MCRINRPLKPIFIRTTSLNVASTQLLGLSSCFFCSLKLFYFFLLFCRSLILDRCHWCGQDDGMKLCHALLRTNYRHEYLKEPSLNNHQRSGPASASSSMQLGYNVTRKHSTAIIDMIRYHSSNGEWSHRFQKIRLGPRRYPRTAELTFDYSFCVDLVDVL